MVGVKKAKAAKNFTVQSSTQGTTEDVIQNKTDNIGTEQNANEAFASWRSAILAMRIPRWSQFPDIELYAEQVVSFVEKYTAIFFEDDEKPITPAMINNYVKLKLIPPPVKKKYNSIHLAYLITITILKQVITIPEIRDGIHHQAKISGSRAAYDLFCTEQENAFKAVLCAGMEFPQYANVTLTEQDNIAANESSEVTVQLCEEQLQANFTAARTAALAFAYKSVARKIIHLQCD